jgi:hypothetical protein
VAGSVLWGVFSFTALFLGQQPGGACRSRRLCDYVAGTLAAGFNINGRKLGLGFAAAVGLAAAAEAAEPAAPIQVRAEGSFPLQYIESVSSASRQHTLSAAPYLGLIATAHLAPDVSTSVFVNGGHNELGSFRDNDNTFVSAGGNLVKRWGALSTGISVEHTHYYDGIFGPTTNVANDVNLFVGYLWRPSPDLKITPAATVTIRLDDAFVVQRYTYGARLEIEQRLAGPWWAFVTPRLRYLDFVGSEAGRRDLRVAIVGGLKYVFNDSVSARMLAGYENRSSNVAGKGSDKFTVGVSVDFDIDFTRSRGLGGR